MGLADDLAEQYGSDAYDWRKRREFPEVQQAMKALNIGNYTGTAKQNTAIQQHLRNRTENNRNGSEVNMPDFLGDLYDRILRAQTEDVPRGTAIPGPGWVGVDMTEPKQYIERDKEIELDPFHLNGTSAQQPQQSISDAERNRVNMEQVYSPEAIAYRQRLADEATAFQRQMHDLRDQVLSRFKSPQQLSDYLKKTGVTDPVAQKFADYYDVREYGTNAGFKGENSAEFEQGLRKFKWMPGRPYCKSTVCSTIQASELPDNEKTVWRLVSGALARETEPMAKTANKKYAAYTGGQPLFIISDTPRIGSIYAMPNHNNYVMGISKDGKQILTANGNRRQGVSVGWEPWSPERSSGKFVYINPELDWSKVNMTGLNRLADEYYKRRGFRR